MYLPKFCFAHTTPLLHRFFRSDLMDCSESYLLDESLDTQFIVFIVLFSGHPSSASLFVPHLIDGVYSLSISLLMMQNVSNFACCDGPQCRTAVVLKSEHKHKMTKRKMMKKGTLSSASACLLMTHILAAVIIDTSFSWNGNGPILCAAFSLQPQAYRCKGNGRRLSIAFRTRFNPQDTNLHLSDERRNFHIERQGFSQRSMSTTTIYSKQQSDDDNGVDTLREATQTEKNTIVPIQETNKTANQKDLSPQEKNELFSFVTMSNRVGDVQLLLLDVVLLLNLALSASFWVVYRLDVMKTLTVALNEGCLLAVCWIVAGIYHDSFSFGVGESKETLDKERTAGLLGLRTFATASYIRLGIALLGLLFHQNLAWLPFGDTSGFDGAAVELLGGGDDAKAWKLISLELSVGVVLMSIWRVLHSQFVQR